MNIRLGVEVFGAIEITLFEKGIALFFQLVGHVAVGAMGWISEE